MENNNNKLKINNYRKAFKVIKRYMYNPLKVFVMVLFFPIVFFLSFLCSKLFIFYLFNYKRIGLSKQGFKLNSWDQLIYDLKIKGIRDFAIDKNDINEFELKMEGNIISALKIINKNSNNWVIGLHGFKRNKYIGLRNCNFFYNKGYNILTFDAYAHGNTYGFKSDFGVTNAKILDFLIKWIKQKYNPSEIGIIGVSMGASTSLLFAKEYYIKNKVDWVIVDCPFIEAIIQIRFFLKKYLKIPWFFMSLGIKRNFKSYAKSDISTMNMFDGYENFKDLPILFIHGFKDDFITYNCSIVMYNLKIQQEKNKISDLMIFKNAKHSSCYHKNENEYKEKIFNFINNFKR
ncbi:alpha/beta hydrolase [Spiroplasma tabanidicola]|uniref:Alpha/beta fold hydrolase n=1 Tax=Spiroplasma tabanidicola TaxID=324079 RepID=A0A6I6CBY3_9MOLU|nr:alpha/beta hydrolase [Spiroplasma tabanidicola]QGS51738.1 alpha/beta fold hydrolase [Spiroplasma tabanidicola]